MFLGSRGKDQSWGNGVGLWGSLGEGVMGGAGRYTGHEAEK